MAENTDAACTVERDMLAELREGLETPSQSRTSRMLRSGSLRLIKGDREVQELLPGILRELQSCNRTRTGAAQRLREAEALGERLWSEAEMLLAQQARDRRGLPERTAQATKLGQLKACIAELIIAYQLTLADAYTKRQNKAGESLTRLSALRILEWTWREHELYRLRYKPLPGSSWLRANRVFFALLSAAVSDAPMNACAAPDFLMDSEGGCTRQALYLNLQAQGLFDVFSWPKTTQGFIAQYCALVPEATRLESWPKPATASKPESSGSTDAYHRFIHPNHNAPPGDAAPEGEGETNTMVLDYSALAAAIRADQHVFFLRDPGGTRSPERLLGLPSPARRPSIRLLARDMDNGAAAPQVEPPREQPEILYLSAGMTTIRALLHQAFSRFPHSHSPNSPPRTRRDPLQQPSNLRTNGDPWKLVYQSARLWRIQNPSTQSSTALSVGTLVALGVGKPGLARPKLGRVARILRTQGVLQIDLQELACFAVPVSVAPVSVASVSGTPTSGEPVKEGLLNSSSSLLSTESSKPTIPEPSSSPPRASKSESTRDDSALRALLIYDEDFGWGLMTPPQQQIHEGDAIAIRTNRMNIESKLRSVRDATQDFLLFQINPHDPQLGVPSYPRAHKARRRSASHRSLTQKTTDSRNPAESEYRPPRF